jgi:hypothetical protein
MDLLKVNLLLKFSLACAGQNDEVFHRQLGPIHLIKYVYLADIYYAERHNGQTFTGVPWKFYHYGPWSLNVYQQIEKAIEEIGAEIKKISSVRFDNDTIRYVKRDDRLYDNLEKQIPLEIVGPLIKAIRTFGDNTSDLLHYVYITPPILGAAPNEELDFLLLIKSDTSILKPNEDDAVNNNLEQMSKTKRKKLELDRQEKKVSIRKRLAEKHRTKRVAPPTPPVYDDVFYQGLDWLDSLAGEPISECEGKIFVSDEIWKSDARKEHDI